MLFHNDIIKIFMIMTDIWSINCVDWYSGTLEGLRTSNNTEEWHSKLRKLAGKAHPIYKAVTLFQSEQAVTEISLIQLAAGRLPKRRIRKYRNNGKRLTTINEEYEAGNYTLWTTQGSQPLGGIYIASLASKIIFTNFRLSIKITFKFRRNGTRANFVRQNGYKLLSQYQATCSWPPYLQCALQRSISV